MDTLTSLPLGILNDVFEILSSPFLGSGCGSVAVLTEEGTFDTANYPGLYPSNTKCHWLIEAPEEHVIKVIKKTITWG